MKLHLICLPGFQNVHNRADISFFQSVLWNGLGQYDEIKFCDHEFFG